MDFRTAANTNLPFGPFQGQTLDQTAETDDGLRYLDNLFAKMRFGQIRTALARYLSEPVIARALDNLVKA